jgi:hypothetical protein
MPRPPDPARAILWRHRLRQQLDSGLSIHQFCLREGVSTASFHAWKRRLAARTNLPAVVSSGKSAFVPVIVSPTTASHPGDAAELVTIQLPNGGQVLLPIAVGVEFVCQVVDTVARSPRPREALSC